MLREPLPGLREMTERLVDDLAGQAFVFQFLNSLLFRECPCYPTGVLLLRSSAPSLAFTCWTKRAEQTFASVSQPCAENHHQLKVTEAADLHSVQVRPMRR